MMRQELRDLEKIVESEAERRSPGQRGNVARAVVKLASPVVIESGFKSRFSAGHGKLSVELPRGAEMLAYDFSSAILSKPVAVLKSSDSTWKDKCVPLAALPTEILRELIEKSGGAKVPRQQLGRRQA